MLPFIEIDFATRPKHSTSCSGDVFLSRRQSDRTVLIAALADGLGSGLQANTAASLTATMAMEYMGADIDLRRAAELVMDALPICPDRHISYSTFTLVHASLTGETRMIEYGNPPALLLRKGSSVPLPRETLRLPRWNGREMTYATFACELDDRIFFSSDGITQAGLGTARYPFGWGTEELSEELCGILSADPGLSARELCRRAVQKALHLDGGLAGDDTTCSVVHFRAPRILQVLTGPPFSRRKDSEFAALVNTPGVKTVIAGGSTAELIARELNRPLAMPIANLDPEIPAVSIMEGAALVTEGCITLCKVLELLEKGEDTWRSNGATQMRDLFLESDRICFHVGTSINPAHQDPNLPVELEIRRNLIRRLSALLETRYFKEVFVSFC